MRRFRLCPLVDEPRRQRKPQWSTLSNMARERVPFAMSARIRGTRVSSADPPSRAGWMRIAHRRLVDKHARPTRPTLRRRDAAHVRAHGFCARSARRPRRRVGHRDRVARQDGARVGHPRAARRGKRSNTRASATDVAAGASPAGWVIDELLAATTTRTCGKARASAPPTAADARGAHGLRVCRSRARASPAGGSSRAPAGSTRRRACGTARSARRGRRSRGTRVTWKRSIASSSRESFAS